MAPRMKLSEVANTWALFIDDERFPPSSSFDIDWRIARSVDEAKDLINRYGCPAYISFDHDLGDKQPTGKDLADWLVEKDLDEPGFLPTNFTFAVHSMNPIGAKNIEGLLTQYLRQRNG